MTDIFKEYLGIIIGVGTTLIALGVIQFSPINIDLRKVLKKILLFIWKILKFIFNSIIGWAMLPNKLEKIEKKVDECQANTDKKIEEINKVICDLSKIITEMKEDNIENEALRVRLLLPSLVEKAQECPEKITNSVINNLTELMIKYHIKHNQNHDAYDNYEIIMKCVGKEIPQILKDYRFRRK